MTTATVAGVLIECPECGRKVSDRAKACPDCGLPVAEVINEQREAQANAAARKTRVRVGEVDCPRCDARGFEMLEEDGRQVFAWCEDCENTGRTDLYKASDGFFAVSRKQQDAFEAGTVDAGAAGVTHLGTEPPKGFRYETVGKRYSSSDVTAETGSSSNDGNRDGD